MPSPSQELLFGTGGHHAGLIEAVLLHSRSLGCPVGFFNPTRFNRKRSLVWTLLQSWFGWVSDILNVHVHKRPYDSSGSHTQTRGGNQMRKSQIGDRVKAHYTKRFKDGSMRSSRINGDPPLELVIGTGHPRLPGVAAKLVGVAEGQTVKLHVPADEAYGKHDPEKIFRVDRARFPADEKLAVGKWVLMMLSRGRTRRVRIMELHERAVVIDANHPRCGQSLDVEVELVAFLAPMPS
jgi:peptidylprolyl isomerase